MIKKSEESSFWDYFCDVFSLCLSLFLKLHSLYDCAPNEYYHLLLYFEMQPILATKEEFFF